MGVYEGHRNGPLDLAESGNTLETLDSLNQRIIETGSNTETT